MHRGCSSAMKMGKRRVITVSSQPRSRAVRVRGQLHHTRRQDRNDNVAHAAHFRAFVARSVDACSVWTAFAAWRSSSSSLITWVRSNSQPTVWPLNRCARSPARPVLTDRLGRQQRRLGATVALGRVRRRPLCRDGRSAVCIWHLVEQPCLSLRDRVAARSGEPRRRTVVPAWRGEPVAPHPRSRLPDALTCYRCSSSVCATDVA